MVMAAPGERCVEVSATDVRCVGLSPLAFLGPLGVVLISIVFSSCGRAPPPERLSELRAEAMEANSRALSAQRDRDDEEDGRTLRVLGEVTPVVLSWETLDQLSTSHVRTKNTQNPTDRTRVIEYRGVLVRDLLDRVHASDTVEELTFVSSDGFRSTVKTADARRYDILLAVQADGKPLARSEGGPLYLVFPHSDAPITEQLYPDRYWAFYVTHLIVGTESLSLRIAGRSFDGRAFAALSEVSMREVVGWKVHWPSTPIRVRGVRLADAIRAVGLSPGPDSTVTLRGKSLVHRSLKRPRTLPFGDVERCGMMLVTHSGEEDAPVPARLGGPVASAMPAVCAARYGEDFWVPFLEEVLVEVAR
jgi:hypothetical protein